MKPVKWPQGRVLKSPFQVDIFIVLNYLHGDRWLFRIPKRISSFLLEIDPPDSWTPPDFGSPGNPAAAVVEMPIAIPSIIVLKKTAVMFLGLGIAGRKF